MIDSITTHKIDTVCIQNVERYLQNYHTKIDSLQNVLVKHQITESYFNHILNAQLAIFILIVTLIVLISIGGYIVFFKKYFKKKIDMAKADIFNMFEIEKLKLSAWNNFALYELYSADSKKNIECVLYTLKIVEIYMTRKLSINQDVVALNKYIEKWIDKSMEKLNLIDKITKDNILLPYFEDTFYALEDTIRERKENFIFANKFVEIKRSFYSKIL